ncbi:MAG: CBS domain-containing protein [Candidatus Baldrarchaeota archaeon]
MKVSNIMTRNVVYVEVPGNREHLLELMNKHGVMGLPVMKKGTKEVVGIVTRTDLMQKPDEEQIAMLMTRDPIVTTPDTDIKDVAKILLEKNIRRLPVVENGELVGIVTVADIVWKAISRMNIDKPIKPYVQKKITAVWEGTPLPVAYIVMRLADVQALPVLGNEGQLVGIITDTDFISLSEVVDESKVSEVSAASEGTKWSWDASTYIYIAKKKLKLPKKLVSEVMVTNVIKVAEQISVSECAKMMRKYDIDQFPVVNAKGDLVGMITDVNLLNVLLET